MDSESNVRSRHEGGCYPTRTIANERFVSSNAARTLLTFTGMLRQVTVEVKQSDGMATSASVFSTIGMRVEA